MPNTNMTAAFEQEKLAYCHQGKPKQWQDGFDSGFAEGWKALAETEDNSRVTRLERLVTSMRDRATDNPQGIQADTLAMFAEELQLAIKP